uniref:Uncharacterized protein n=1 Tax=Noctiluca scintillans TaxID=2966 RepID=A0A7S0ZV81_NOCSC|mmetsp:Transcript_20385/g.54543  ORF Transcript_20385/g.54543 Transcript_20385/m.54543 type:complete len:210 (+) Transcript_20385:64-693(+)
MFVPWWFVGAIAHVCAESVDDVVYQVSSDVHQRYGDDFDVIEFSLCRENPVVSGVQCMLQEPMSNLSQVGFMRIVYIVGPKTSPNIQAWVDLSASPATWDIEEHNSSWLDDSVTGGYPPSQKMTVESELDRLQAAVGNVQFHNIVFRKPFYPCVSEPLLMFFLVGQPPTQSVFSVGGETGGHCWGFVTQKSNMTMCQAPNCFAVDHRLV